MRRGLLGAGAWSLATGAAVTLSWWGVHTVMAGTAYDPPRAVPLTARDHADDPVSSSTHRPGPAPVPRPTPPPRPRASAEPPRRETATARPPSRGPSERPERPERSAGTGRSSGHVRGYSTDGGRVVFDLGRDAAALVSASPAPGWSMRVWKAPAWIRVEFTSGADRVSVFCVWHDRAPRVDITTY
ncbi:hypothetical protein [Streptomyces longispororuber]|uniref:hypothetical protein n=1 Tax=Streptomyces longispororuber TaxID=68230 RepID=UPI0036FD517A